MLRKGLYILMLTTGIYMICLVNNGLSQDYQIKGSYRLARSTYSGPLISAIKVYELCANENLGSVYSQDYALLSARHYKLLNNTNKNYIDLLVGLHPTISETEDAVLGFLNVPRSVSAVAWENPPMGDTAWRLQETNGRTSWVVFIRRNAVISLSSTMVDVISLAKTIDSAIMNGAPYITVEEVLTPPIIQSVALSKNPVTENESFTMTVQAFDPKGLKLIYRSHLYPFGHADPNEKDNIFTMYATRETFPQEEFDGDHIIKVFVVNENNLFSKIKEVPITFSPPPR